MTVLMTVEQKRRWTAIHDLLNDLLQNPGKLDALTDIMYKLIWEDNLYEEKQEELEPESIGS